MFIPKPRKIHWSSRNSDMAAHSTNVFVRIIGAYLDKQAGFKPCIGHRHWGVNGAAGILPVHTTSKGLYALLAKRAGWSQAGGTWSTFGGAIDGDETRWEAAVREGTEEVGGIVAEPAGILLTTVASCPFGCGWDYTTFVVEVTAKDTTRPAFLPWVRLLGVENNVLAWVPVHQVADHKLHPEFAKAWPDMLEFIAEPGSDEPGFYGEDLADVAETFYVYPPRPKYVAPKRTEPARRVSAAWLLGDEWAGVSDEDLADALDDADRADARWTEDVNALWRDDSPVPSRWSDMWGDDPYAAS